MNRKSGVHPAFFVFLLLVLTIATAAPAWTPGDAHWDSRFQPAGITGYVNAMLSRPGELVIGGNFSAVGNQPTANVALLATSGGVVTGSTALGDGFDNGVYAFCQHEGQIVAGGLFDASGETALNRVARWDGSAWQPLGDGLPGVLVRTLASYGGHLYAGGYRWDGEAWTEVLPTDGTIMRMEVHDALLYVGGNFTTARGDTVNHVFAWNGTDVLPLGDGLPWEVKSSSAGPGGVVFVSQGNDAYGQVLRWDGASWILEQENTFLQSVAYHGSGLVISNSLHVGGGQFQPAIQGGGGGSWYTLGDFTTSVMTEHEGVLFMRAGEGVEPGLFTAGLIVYDHPGMREVFPPGDGYGRGFHALASLGEAVLVGGEFTHAEGQVFDGAGLCHADGWLPWGGRADLELSYPGWFEDLEYLGAQAYGIYSFVDWDYTAQMMVRSTWDGAQWRWEPFGQNWGLYGDLLTVGADLIHWNSNEVNQVDLATGDLFPLPGLNLDDGINAACSHQEDLVIGGRFTTNGGLQVSNVLRRTGESWQSVGNPLPEPPHVLASMEEDGLAAAYWDWPEYRVALFDGTAWTTLPGGFTYGITHMIYHRGRLFVAGSFDRVGPMDVGGLVVWTGTGWAPVGSGIAGGYGRVEDMVSVGDALYVTGNFATAGGYPNPGLAAWTGDPATLSVPAGVDDDPLPTLRRLHRPVPNPFNPVTRVSFDLPREGMVTIAVHDARGARVRTLENRHYPAGTHAVTWDGTDVAGRALPSGVYFAVMTAGGARESVKLTLVR